MLPGHPGHTPAGPPGNIPIVIILAGCFNNKQLLDSIHTLVDGGSSSAGIAVSKPRLLFHDIMYQKVLEKKPHENQLDVIRAITRQFRGCHHGTFSLL